MRGTLAAAATLVTLVRRAGGVSDNGCGRDCSTARSRGDLQRHWAVPAEPSAITGGFGSPGGFIVRPVLIGVSKAGPSD